MPTVDGRVVETEGEEADDKPRCSVELYVSGSLSGDDCMVLLEDIELRRSECFILRRDDHLQSFWASVRSCCGDDRLGAAQN